MVLRTALIVIIALLAVAVVFPLYSLLSMSLQDMDGEYVGLENFRIYFDTPALFASITNSLSVAISATLIVLGIAFVYAYACLLYTSPSPRDQSGSRMPSSA